MMLRELLVAILEPDIATRLTIEGVQESPWLSDVGPLMPKKKVKKFKKWFVRGKQSEELMLGKEVREGDSDDEEQRGDEEDVVEEEEKEEEGEEEHREAGDVKSGETQGGDSKMGVPTVIKQGEQGSFDVESLAKSGASSKTSKEADCGHEFQAQTETGQYKSTRSKSTGITGSDTDYLRHSRTETHVDSKFDQKEYEEPEASVISKEDSVLYGLRTSRLRYSPSQLSTVGQTGGWAEEEVLPSTQALEFDPLLRPGRMSEGSPLSRTWASPIQEATALDLAGQLSMKGPPRHAHPSGRPLNMADIPSILQAKAMFQKPIRRRRSASAVDKSMLSIHPTRDVPEQPDGQKPILLDPYIQPALKSTDQYQVTHHSGRDTTGGHSSLYSGLIHKPALNLNHINTVLRAVRAFQHRPPQMETKSNLQ